MRSSLLPLFLIILTLTACNPGETEHNKGVLYLKFKDLESSEKNFIAALIRNPNLSISRYGLSFSLFPREKLKEALKELDSLITNKTNEETLFKIYFGKAVIYTMLGEIDPTLDFYQKCLYIKPDSKEVKTNIELLFGGEDGEGPGKALVSKMSKKKSKKKTSQEGDSDKEVSKHDENSEQKQKAGGDKDSLKKKNLSPQELERILEELKQQEKKIRAKGYNGQQGVQGKDKKSSGGKPW